MNASAPSRLTRLTRLPRAYGLHGQVALVALVLLVIPWVGYTYVKAMETLLRENQEQQVIAAARGIATALQDRPRLLELHGPTKKLNEIKILPDIPPTEADTPTDVGGTLKPLPLPPPPEPAVPQTKVSDEVRVILSGLARAGLRIWVVDSR